MVVNVKKNGMVDLYCMWWDIPRPRRITKKRWKNHDRKTLRENGIRFRANTDWRGLRKLVIDKVVTPRWAAGLEREIRMPDPLFDGRWNDLILDLRGLPEDKR